MKLGVSSYSYSQLVGQGKMAQIEVIAKARETGFDVFEFSAIAVPPGATLLSYASQLRSEADRVGLPIVNYAIGADFLNGSNGDWKAEVRRLETEIRVAQVLGCRSLRHDATCGFPAGHTGPRAFADALPVLGKACREVTLMAADCGLRTTVENHGFFCQDSDRLEQLVSAVNHPNFGVLIDIGNFLCADDDPVRAVGRLAGMAVHVHAKDFHVKSGQLPDPGSGWFRSRGGNYLRGAIVGHGDVPVPQCLRILKQAGYDGVVSLEFEGMEDPLTGIAIGLENLRRYVTGLG